MPLNYEKRLITNHMASNTTGQLTSINQSLPVPLICQSLTKMEMVSRWQVRSTNSKYEAHRNMFCHHNRHFSIFRRLLLKRKLFLLLVFLCWLNWPRRAGDERLEQRTREVQIWSATPPAFYPFLTPCPVRTVFWYNTGIPRNRVSCEGGYFTHDNLQ